AEAFRVLLKQAVRLGGHDEMNKIVGLERSILEKVKFFSLTCNMEREAAITAHNGLECSAR
ncbi:MAG: hypothetical protein IIY88_02430, partial [Eubacterium sp.]|nr:hypothetical protein [Eubacterium sp.]